MECAGERSDLACDFRREPHDLQAVGSGERLQCRVPARGEVRLVLCSRGRPRPRGPGGAARGFGRVEVEVRTGETFFEQDHAGEGNRDHTGKGYFWPITSPPSRSMEARASSPNGPCGRIFK